MQLSLKQSTWFFVSNLQSASYSAIDVIAAAAADGSQTGGHGKQHQLTDELDGDDDDDDDDDDGITGTEEIVVE